MKYIRTEDGIYKYADYLGIHNGKRYALMDDAQGNRITMCQEPEELYKVADNIEDLFDECYLDAPHYREPAIMFSLDDAKLQKSDNERLFGCIWVKLPNGAKRLEPVAEKVTDGWRLL